MRTLLFLLLAVFQLQFLAACYPAEVENAKASPELLNMPSEGGEYTVRIVTASGSKRHPIWSYNGLSVPKDSGPFLSIEDTTARVDSFADGSFKVYNDWVSFSVPRDMYTIRVKAAANHTGKSRESIFFGFGGYYSFRLTVSQSPSSTQK